MVGWWLAAATRAVVGFSTIDVDAFLDGRVSAHPVAPHHAGADGSLSLTIAETPAPDMPLLVWLTASEGISLLENRWTWDHVVDRQAVQPRLQGRFRGREQGRHSIDALVMYGTCDDEWCRPRFARVQWIVEILPAVVPPE